MKPKLLTTLKDYSWRLFLGDALAGITVALVALPLSIAIAIASGQRRRQGLSPRSSAASSFRCWAEARSRSAVRRARSSSWLPASSPSLASMGCCSRPCLPASSWSLAGLVSAGRFIALVPEPVIEGFTVGIALIIAVSQLKDLLGFSAAHVPADLVHGLPALWAARGQLNVSALWPSACSRSLGIAPASPSHSLVSGIAARYRRRFRGGRVLFRCRWIRSTLASEPFLPACRSLTFRISALRRISELLPSAFVIAFLAAVESLLSAIVADRMIGGSHRSGAELLAQGAANIVSPLFGGLPATGAIARTATNVRAGGRTPVAGIVHAATILLIVVRCRAARGVSHHAGARWPAHRDSVADERTGTLVRAHESAARAIVRCSS